MPRWLLNFVGLCFVGLGIVGLIVPGLPGTIFFILAAVIFTQSNPAWEAKIMAHPKIGPAVKAFRERGVMNRAAKVAALTGMVVGGVFGIAFLPGYLKLLPLIIIIPSAIYVYKRPEH